MGTIDSVDSASAGDSATAETSRLQQIDLEKNIGDWGPSRRTAGQVTFAQRKKHSLYT